LVTGFIALHTGQAGGHGLLYAQNGIIAYLLFFRNFSGPLSEELALPYIYTLPGTFFRKTLAVNTLHPSLWLERISAEPELCYNLIFTYKGCRHIHAGSANVLAGYIRILGTIQYYCFSIYPAAFLY
jgi:hypothetical protein